MFIPDRSYQAWIRFLMLQMTPLMPTLKRCTWHRNKILGVSGQKILESEKQATTQDFIMINHPVFCE